MKLPEEAKRLLRLEAKNLTELRKKLRNYMRASVVGGAIQILQLKKEIEEMFTTELLKTKLLTKQQRTTALGTDYIGGITEADYISAHIAASSFSNAWASAQMASAPFNWDSRLRRIVATETSRSYSDVIEEAATDFNLIRQWVSVLDAKTCKFCRNMDGEKTLPGEPFKDGFEPGYVHPNCRCYSILVIK